MTERWRKRLGTLDDVSPSDEVLHRAKSGPQLPEAMIPRPKAATRVATAIAAFVVFALAVSVFAIPALRMRGGASLSGAGLQPLWPWHSISDVEAFTSDPHAIGDMAASDVDSAEAVAASFGRQVLGWGDRVWADGFGVAPQDSCGNYSEVLSPPSTHPVSTPTIGCVIDYPDAYDGPASSAAFPAFRTFDLTTCPQNAICDYGYPGPGNASVVMYQPLGSDGPWAVLEAKSQYAHVSVSSPGPIRDGDTVNTGVQAPTDYFIESGAASGAGPCAFAQATTAYHSPGIAMKTGLISAGEQLDVQLSPLAAGCSSMQNGYAFVAVADETLRAQPPVTDPIAGGGPRLFAFAAVPMTFLFPEPQQTATETLTVEQAPTPTATRTATPVAIALGSYSDQLGWTIDVPKSWDHGVADNVSNLGMSSTGAWFSSGYRQVIPGPLNFPDNPVPPDDGVMIRIWHPDVGPSPGGPGDDSSFPLSPGDLQPDPNAAGTQAMTFHGDGLEFDLEVVYGQQADEASFQSIVDHMIESIAFRPWHVGETRNGLTALESPNGSPQWQGFGDTSKQVIVVPTSDVPEGYVMLGPVTCDDNGSMTTDWAPSTACPDNLTGATWDAKGRPSATNPPGFQHPLAVHPVIHSWDGKLLGSFEVTVDYSTT